MKKIPLFPEANPQQFIPVSSFIGINFTSPKKNVSRGDFFMTYHQDQYREKMLKSSVFHSYKTESQSAWALVKTKNTWNSSQWFGWLDSTTITQDKLTPNSGVSRVTPAPFFEGYHVVGAVAENTFDEAVGKLHLILAYIRNPKTQMSSYQTSDSWENTGDYKGIEKDTSVDKGEGEVKIAKDSKPMDYYLVLPPTVGKTSGKMSTSFIKNQGENTYWKYTDYHTKNWSRSDMALFQKDAEPLYSDILEASTKHIFWENTPTLTLYGSKGTKQGGNSVVDTTNIWEITFEKTVVGDDPKYRRWTFTHEKLISPRLPAPPPKVTPFPVPPTQPTNPSGIKIPSTPIKNLPPAVKIKNPKEMDPLHEPNDPDYHPPMANIEDPGYYETPPEQPGNSQMWDLDPETHKETKQQYWERELDYYGYTQNVRVGLALFTGAAIYTGIQFDAILPAVGVALAVDSVPFLYVFGTWQVMPKVMEEYYTLYNDAAIAKEQVKTALADAESRLPEIAMCGTITAVGVTVTAVVVYFMMKMPFINAYAPIAGLLGGVATLGLDLLVIVEQEISLSGALGKIF